MDVKSINLANILLVAINPRVIYTQIGVYRLGKAIFLKRLAHKEEDLTRFKNVADQTKYRSEMIMAALADNEIAFDEIKLVMGRGGLIHPVEPGIDYFDHEMVITLLQ